jgi:hypothetical protein
MKRSIFFLLMIIISVAFSAAQTINIHSGSVSSDKDNWSSLPLFSAYKGDKIKFEAQVDHKRKDVKLYVVQYPGDLIVYANDAMEADNYEFVVPSDAIYGFWYKGAGENVSLNVDRIAGPNTKSEPLKWQMVVDQDTLHDNGFSDVVIGKTVKYLPRVQRVKIREMETSEVLSNTSYGLIPEGGMMYPIEVPNSDVDNYRKKEIVGLTVTLTAGNSTYEALKGVVTKGLTAAANKAVGSATKAGAKKMVKKQDPSSNYDFVEDIFAEKEKLETAQELLELGAEAAEVLGDSTDENSNGEKLSKGMDVGAYVLQPGGFQKVMINKIMEENGKGELSVSGLTGYEIPSIKDLAGKAADLITPKVDDKVTLRLMDVTANMDTLFVETGGFITKEVLLDGSEYKVYYLSVMNPRKMKDLKNLANTTIHGNVIVEAKYRLTDYADMVYFDRVEEPVTTKKYFKTKKLETSKKLVLEGQKKPWESELSAGAMPGPPTVMVIPD